MSVAMACGNVQRIGEAASPWLAGIRDRSRQADVLWEVVYFGHCLEDSGRAYSGFQSPKASCPAMRAHRRVRGATVEPGADPLFQEGRRSVQPFLG